jgi:hypothetical protein
VEDGMGEIASAEWFRWTIFAVTMLGVVLNIKKNRWCFPVWLVANVAWLIINLEAGIIQGAITYGIFILT